MVNKPAPFVCCYRYSSDFFNEETNGPVLVIGCAYLVKGFADLKKQLLFAVGSVEQTSVRV